MNKITYEGYEMKKTYKAQNINCINCSNLIKGSLEDEFGEIAVNLETEPKEVTVEIKDEKNEAHFINEMADIGFDIIDE
jgi:copper chaperone CopZ